MKSNAIEQKAEYLKKQLFYFVCFVFALITSIVIILLDNIIAYASGYDVSKPHVIINQIYGAGDAGLVSHSFIEIYNPTDSEVDISGWSLQYRASESSSVNNGEWSVFSVPE